jgi:acyl carrier protein
MTNSEVRSFLEGIISEVFEIPEGSIVLQDDLDLRYLGDSLKRLELLAIVESRFGISIDVDTLCYFGDLVRMIERAPHGQSA